MDKAFSKVPSKYDDFANVFLHKLAAKLLKYTRTNDFAIELIDNWQPPYGPIYILGPVELKTLKVYIKNNLANNFIWPFNFPNGALIFLDKNLDSIQRLCIDYQGHNNLTIKNLYPLSLIGESMDWPS